jgi:arylsulfatase A-like enzyme/Flp pilus assembly protein TadD
VIAAAVAFGACHAAPRPPAPAPIVLITIDTLRADHVDARRMPALDALGRDAIVFDQALTVSPLTLPAHASLLTGRYPPRHGVRDNEIFSLAPEIPVYPALLKQRGYATAAFVSAPVLDHRYGLQRGFDVYDDEIAGAERSAGDTLARATRWLATAPRPFFVWIHLFEPHAPYLSGSYANEVKAVDVALDGFFEHLRHRRLWDDLMLSVSADHGESLGEHEEQTHGFFLYDATLRIPWILKAPGLRPRRVTDLVRIVDEMPTILDAARVVGHGVGGPPIDGVSVAPSIEAKRSPGLEAYSETFLPRDQFGWSPLTSVRTTRYKYIDAPQPELYDLAGDPSETMNIVASGAAEAGRLKTVLAAIGRGPAAPSQSVTADAALTEKLMSLGYFSASPVPDGPGSRLPDPKSKIGIYNACMTALERAEQGDLTGALRLVEQAERMDPNVAQIEFLKGTLLGRLGRYQEAASALERTLALNPHHTAARFKLALAWVRIGHDERADRLLREVVRQQPEDFRAWHNLAAIAYGRGDLREAEALERKAVALSPEYGEAWNTLGAIALVRKQTNAAVDALTKATEVAPHNAQAFANLSIALRAAGRDQAARSASERACVLDQRFCSR